MDLTPKQQTSEAIRQADSILLLTGQHPSVDQAAALVSLAMILRKFGKQATAVMTDNPPQAIANLNLGVLERNVGGPRDFVMKVDLAKAEVDKLRYEVVDGKLNVVVTPYRGNFEPNDVTFGYGEASAHFDLVVVVGVPTRARIDRAYEQNAQALTQVPVINLDFHRSNENYGAVNLIDSNASSLCEILVALSESLQGGIIDADIATPLLMGIVASTDRFTATHTTSKSLTVAAQMMAAGAKQQAVIKALYRNGNNNEGRDRGDGRDRGQQSRREGGEARREPVSQPQPARMPEPTRQPEPVRTPEPVAPVAPAAAQTVPNLDAATRMTDTSPELPIIQPRHIVPGPAEPAASEPAAAAAFAPQASTPQTPAPERAAEEPGKLPLEMSPLVDLGLQQTRNDA